MPATEDSVLTSLNELRRLRKERRKKGRPTRGPGGNSGSHKTAAASYDLMGDQVTPPPRTDPSMPGKGMRAGHYAELPVAKHAPAGPAFVAPAAATWDAPADPVAFARLAQPKSSAKPAIIVAVVLLAAAGLGYMKLQSDTQSLLDEKNANIRRVEDARAQAMEAAAVAQRQVQDKLRACETRALAASANTPTTAAASVAPAASAAPASHVTSAPASSRGRHKSSGGRRAAAVSAPAAAREQSAVPLLPGKKKLDNDPLAGIKI